MSKQCEACGEPNGELYIHSLCHPTYPTWVTLQEDQHLLVVRCSVCDKHIFSANYSEVTVN